VCERAGGMASDGRQHIADVGAILQMLAWAQTRIAACLLIPMGGKARFAIAAESRS